ncbi:MAG: glucosaminidase domain-containing protein [Paludibacteraceae bacterium]|nr:glucosaminidase domain-containing protein [Paludibacteraceae bacterium]
MSKVSKLLWILLTVLPSVAFAQYDAYVQRYKDIAMREMNDYGIPASITLAQGILESGVGKSDLAVKANNHFGIKCHNDWNGEKVYHDDDKKYECFRKYNRPEDSFIDHSLFLKNRARYSFLFELDKTDYKAWAKGLKQAGYATDPNYAKRLITLIEENNLHQYDLMSYSTPSQEAQTPAKQQAVKNAQGLKFVYVQKGESYYTIAKAHKIPFSSICSYNDVDRKTRQPQEGEIVYLQRKKKEVKGGAGIHVIQAGESMHSISQQYGIQLIKLYDLNNMAYNQKATVGKRLKLR